MEVIYHESLNSQISSIHETLHVDKPFPVATFRRTGQKPRDTLQVWARLRREYLLLGNDNLSCHEILSRPGFRLSYWLDFIESHFHRASINSRSRLLNVHPSLPLPPVLLCDSTPVLSTKHNSSARLTAAAGERRRLG